MSEQDAIVVAIDQGTTSARAVAFNQYSSPIAAHQHEITQHSPKPGWLEQDPEEIAEACRICLQEVASQLQQKGYSISAVRGIGIANQRETSVLWDRRTGKPVCNAIVWSDGRTIELVKELRLKEGADRVREVCGLHIDSYFAAPKIRWLLDNDESVREVYEAGELCFGTIDSWIIHALSGGEAHVTDVSNSSRSMLVDLKTCAYSDFLLGFFGFEKMVLPEIRPSSSILASMDGTAFSGTPIGGCIGDQSSALVGHLGFDKGDAKNTYGTGCFFLYNTGNTPIISKKGLLTTVAYQLPDGKPVYALEGSIAVCGSVIKWLRNSLGLIETSHQVGDLISSVPNNAGVYFVTAFSGLFSPYWRPDARGTIIGLTLYSNRAHIIRAAIEAVCFQSRELLEIMEEETGHSAGSAGKRHIRVDGGLTASDIIMQLQADIMGAQIVRPAMGESTALGAAFMAGLATGVWTDLEDIKEKHAQSSVGKISRFNATTTAERRDEEFENWHRAVERASGWVQ